MATETITHRTLRALGHTVSGNELSASPARAGRHGEVTSKDWTLVATALADSDTDSRDWIQAEESWAVVDEALRIRKARSNVCDSDVRFEGQRLPVDACDAISQIWRRLPKRR